MDKSLYSDIAALPKKLRSFPYTRLGPDLCEPTTAKTLAFAPLSFARGQANQGG
jgi:hypothetical protein